MNVIEKASVIVPVYNVEKYLEKCIDSLLNQTYKSYEIILVDDGSTDNGSKILDDYQSKFSNLIKVYHIENGGVSNARNFGISKATGKFILFVDGDDYVSADYIETLVNGFSVDSQLSVADYYIVDTENTFTYSKENNDIVELSTYESLNMINDVRGFRGYVWNKCFLKNVIEENNILFASQYKVMEDHLFCVQYMDCVNKISYIQKPVYFYIQRQDSAVKLVDRKYNNDKLWILENCLQLAKKRGGKFEKEIRKMYSDTMISAFNKNHLFIDNYNKSVIKSITEKVRQTSLNMSRRHKVMYYIMKLFPYIAYLIVKINSRKGKKI